MQVKKYSVWGLCACECG